MFVNERIVKNKKYKYLEHSFRTGKKIRKVSFYLPKSKEKSLKEFLALNRKVIEKTAKERSEFIKRKYLHSKFFDYGTQIFTIEKSRIIYNIFYRKLSDEEKNRVMDDFLRRFLVNSMAMEGGTISYDVAKAIDKEKKFSSKGINELDIPLYRQLRKAFEHLGKMHLRSPSQIKKLHKEIYAGVYPFAGEFRDKQVTFGDLNNLAITSEPKNIKRGYALALKKYYDEKDKVFDFERTIMFHKDYQAVHGFEDGNSRLGRLIMMSQLMHQGYPPLLVKGAQSRAYRKSLVKAINENNNTSLLKFFYENYTRTFNKFWMPILEESMKKNFAKM